MIGVHEALDIVLAAVRRLPAEEVPVFEAYGRAVAGTVVSPERMPSFDNSAMDGYAVRGAELGAGRRQFRVVADVPAGHWPDDAVPEGAAARIMTGAPLPLGVDTVVPVELTESRDDVLVVRRGVPAGANVRRAGEDIVTGDVLFAPGDLLGPAEIGLLAAVGYETVPVVRRPRVAILATGSELVPPGKTPARGQIRNSNSFTTYGQVLAAGGDPELMGIAPDDVESTRRLLSAALQHDVVVTSGGVSVGEYDFVRGVQDELGIDRRFWGVSIKPGKPLVFGERHGTLVFGVPGNPAAAMVTFELFVRPALLALQGRADLYRPWIQAASAEAVAGSRQRTEFRRCRLSHPAREWSFRTTGPQGSSVLRSMTSADGLAIVPPGYPGGEPGEELPVILLAGSSATRPPYPRGEPTDLRSG